MSFKKSFIIIYIFIGLILVNFAVPAYADEDSPQIRGLRKVLIMPEGQTAKGIEMSKELGVSEVAEGIPPAFKNKITEDMLPYVYEEIIYQEPDPLEEEMRKVMEKTGADIAEYYPVSDEGIESGDVVSILDKKEPSFLNSETKYLLGKSHKAYDSKLLGVISSKAAVIINQGNSKTKPEQILRPVALTGMVPVKVSLENGAIEIGDYLTSSNIPGVAMKAVSQGKAIGMALEPLAEVDPKLGYAKIAIFVNVGWYNGSDFSTSTAFYAGQGFFEKLKSIASIVVDAALGLPKLVINGMLEVKEDIATYGVFKGFVTVSKTLIQGRTIMIDSIASIAADSELKAVEEDASNLTFVTYSIVSPRKEIMVSGSGKLLAHSTSSAEVEAKIAFHPFFSAILSEEQPIRVVVTPTSYLNGYLYVAEKNIYGFTVKEINSQDEGLEFDWIVVARLTDPEKAQEVLEITKTMASQESIEGGEVSPNGVNGVCRSGESRPCSSEIGTCQIGIEVCSQGLWEECIGAVFPTAEICDGVDNNCDGEVDEKEICSDSHN